jgi:hypothetical protein
MTPGKFLLLIKLIQVKLWEVGNVKKFLLHYTFSQF